MYNAIFFYRHPGRCTGTIQNYKQPSRSYSNLVHCQFHDLCPHLWIYGWSVQSKICDDCRNYDLVCSHSCRIFHGGLFIYKHYLIFYLFIFSNQLFVYFFFLELLWIYHYENDCWDRRSKLHNNCTNHHQWPFCERY